MQIEKIQNSIYEIRGQKVMLDEDLAAMYNVDTRRLNEQVKRNIVRFPIDFMFQLTQDKWENLMSQNATSSWGGRRKLPNVFTEHGVTMLASVIKSPQAIKINIAIVRAFISLREMASHYKELAEKISKLEKSSITEAVEALKEELLERIDEQDSQLIEIYKVLDKLIAENKEPKSPKRNPIGFKTK